MKKNGLLKVGSIAYMVCFFTGGWFLSTYLEDTPIKEGIEDKITSVMPNIPTWWDEGNFFDVTKECIIPHWVGFAGLLGILAFTAFLIFRWKKIWKRKFMNLIHKPKAACICKECGHAIKSEQQGEICRTCDWYKQV
ncbi:MAG: hypothetical protein ACXACW_11320 [Candidatus Hodarchaeales archaeon]|jgi:hypothetical protein